MKRSGASTWAGVAVLVAMALAIIVLVTRPASPPFDIDSSEPDGYRGVRLLLEDAGGDVRSAGVQEVLAGGTDPGTAVVVPGAALLDDDDLAEVEDLARGGATVVLLGPEGVLELSRNELVRTPAVPVPRGFCDVTGLEQVVELDDLSFDQLTVGGQDQSCFADGFGARVTRRSVGGGEVVALSSPYLWANARLQPDKEEGGRPLDNGALAVALLGAATTVTFVDPEAPPGTAPDGTQDPISLLPLGVKLAIAQAVGAFVLYAWWRGRRLGSPVHEELPVEVAGSELVEAVGGLLRRNGSPARAAEVLRATQRRDLAARLGVPPEAGGAQLIAVIADRTGRDTTDLRAILFDGPVAGADALVRLTHDLDSLRTEVLDGQLTL